MCVLLTMSESRLHSWSSQPESNEYEQGDVEELRIKLLNFVIDDDEKVVVDECVEWIVRVW